MKIQYENKDTDSLNILVSGDIGLDNIKELKDVFELRLTNTKNITILLKDLEYFDLSSLQLLVRTAQEARTLKRNISIKLDLDEDSQRLVDQTGITEGLISSICDLKLI